MNSQLLASQQELITPDATLQHRPSTGKTAFRFASYGRAIIGHGQKATLDDQRVKRLGLGAAARQLLAEQEPGSILVGVVPFDDSSHAPFLFVPETYEELSMHDLPQADHVPPQITQVLGEYNPNFICAVGAAIDEIKARTLSKVVLARTLEVIADSSWNSGTIWRRLYNQNPAGHSFEIELPHDGGIIVGNSPELIAGVRHGQLSSHPLAGSAPRMAEISEDQETAAALAHSPKNLSEHQFVVNHIVQKLRSVATNLRVPAQPDLLATGQMWHLGTMIRADLYKGLGSLDAALAIHPTPAICGSPTEAAQKLIAELEPTSRGFYGGLVGWMNQDGEGEWALLLRSAKLNGTSALLHAGAGIVADSDSFDEHEETAAKFRTMLSALGIDTGAQAT